MRDQEDQMDVGSAGRTRGSGHVRIPQRRINQSLRSGVSPSMNQMTGPQGHFQGAGMQSNYVPIRASKANYGNAFKRFQNRVDGGYPQAPHNIPRPPQAPNHNRFPGGDSGQLRFPHPTPPPRPIIGGGQQTRNGLLQSLMGDIGNGFSADQFAHMQNGTLPGMENGDFQRALGIGSNNDNPLKALAGFLQQGANGQYTMTDPSQMGALQHLLGLAVHAQHPNMPGQFHFPGVPGGPGGPGQIGGGGGQPGGPFPVWGGQPPTIMPGGGGPGGHYPYQPLHQQQNPLQQLLQQRAGRRGQQFMPPMQGQMGA